MVKFATIFIILLFQLSYAVHYFDQFAKMTPQHIDSDSFVVVVQSSKNRTNMKLNKDYYSIKVVKKEKKKAYLRIKETYQKVVKILLKNKIIPSQDNLVKSKIKPQYLSRKRAWLFSIIFVIMGNQKQLQYINSQMIKIGVQKLSTRPAISFLNEKIQAIELFNSAKEKLSERLFILGDYEIKSVVQISLKGKEIQNSNILEQQLQEQFNQSQEIIQEQDIVQSQDLSAHAQIEMKIIFKVGKKEEENSDDEDYLEQDEDDQDQEQDSESQSE